MRLSGINPKPIKIAVFSIVGALSGLAQIGATEPTKRLITGAVIIAAVIIDMYRNKFKQKTK